jgi:hypothetical protein
MPWMKRRVAPGSAHNGTVDKGADPSLSVLFPLRFFAMPIDFEFAETHNRPRAPSENHTLDLEYYAVPGLGSCYRRA